MKDKASIGAVLIPGDILSDQGAFGHGTMFKFTRTNGNIDLDLDLSLQPTIERKLTHG